MHLYWTRFIVKDVTSALSHMHYRRKKTCDTFRPEFLPRICSRWFRSVENGLSSALKSCLVCFRFCARISVWPSSPAVAFMHQLASHVFVEGLGSNPVGGNFVCWLLLKPFNPLIPIFLNFDLNIYHFSSY